MGKIKYFWAVSIISYLLTATIFIRIADISEPLASDAQTFLNQASFITNNISWFTSINKSEVDLGYPIFMSQVIRIFGANILYLQIANYFLWLLSAILIYYSSNKNKPIFLLALFSPVFLSFSLKLFSEPLAAFGVSLLVFSLSRSKPIFWAIISGFLGSLILIPVKVVSIFFLLPLILIAFFRKNIIAIAILLGLIGSLPLWIKSVNGGRGPYTLAVQTAKLQQSYSQILSCASYNLSWPIGRLLNHKDQNLCILFMAKQDMPYYDLNPVVIADERIVYKHPISYYFTLILSNPIKFFVIILIDAINIILFEGVYANILNQLPSILILLLYLYGKIISVILWFFAIKLFCKKPIYILPIVMFIAIHGLTHIEQRYFYPLIPLMYFFLYKSLKILNDTNHDI